MKFSYNWLKSWVALTQTAQEFAVQITMAGIEVESVTPAAPDFSGVVVGQVKSVLRHPHAEKLSLCQVDCGKKQTLSIVCGASNVRENLKVAVATVGAVLPGGKEIKLTEIRKIESQGMLCSLPELGLAEQSDGILELLSDAPIGKDLRRYFDLDDFVIEVSVTPNRGDCLSVAGIAREAGVLNRLAVTHSATNLIKADISDKFPIRIREAQACPRYLGRIIRGVNAAAPTPVWMVERLRRSGMRSLGPLVDVTNYVMLELGQPLHAFDVDQLSGQIEVRLAHPDEKMILLDGKQISLDSDTLVIADQQKVLALAGIMGGEGSGISASTKAIFLECAFFSPEVISGKARRYNLHTESSFRFERGVDPQLQKHALDRVTELVLSICGGQCGPVIEVSSEAHLPKTKTIVLRAERIRRLLGVEVSAKDVRDILTRLGMKLSGGKDAGWQVSAPSFRFDIAIEADLIEEIGRIYGYNQIGMRMPSADLTMTMEPETQIPLERFKSVLVARGYQEVITYSFVNPKLQTLLDPEVPGIMLANPMSADMGVMRTSLWPGLINTLSYNVNRQQTRMAIFETGLTFVRLNGTITQKPKIGALLAGSTVPLQWGVKPCDVDFYDFKSDIEALISLTLNPSKFEFQAALHPALHPGQSARIICAGQAIGWLGKLHPEIQIKQDLTLDTFLVELDIMALQDATLPKFKPLSKFPSIRRDLAVVVKESVTAQQVCNSVRACLPEQLQDVVVFDLYRGQGIEIGTKSLALGLILQESSRTLVDQEVDAAIAKVVFQLNHDLGATLRE